MNLIRIDHVSLDVHDRPASLAWYEEVLGLRATARHAVPDQPVFLGIAYHPERYRDHDSLYFPDLDGTVLEVMVPRA